jgi:5-methylcytosine-specific restriction endonuclease McrA
MYAARYGWHCHWCGILLDFKTITADHLTPISEGGSDREPNIVPACKDCNRKRGTTAAYR